MASGRVAIAAWQVSMRTTSAIRLAIHSCNAGGMVLSAVEIWIQAGFVCHAGA